MGWKSESAREESRKLGREITRLEAEKSDKREQIKAECDEKIDNIQKQRDDILDEYYED